MKKRERGQISISLTTIIAVLSIIFISVVIYFVLAYKGNSSTISKLDKKNDDTANLFGDNEVTTNNVVNEENNEDTEETTKKKEVGKIYENKDLVFTYFSQDSDENALDEYSYKIPNINIDTEEVKNINRKIINTLEPTVKQEIRNSSQGYSIMLIKVKYDYYINDDILSLVIIEETNIDQIVYFTYNVNIKEGKEVKNTELLELKNISEQNYLEKLNNLFYNKYKELWGAQENNSVMHDDFEKQLNKTLSPNNIKMDIPMFLDKNGKINVIAPIYSLAGADVYYYIINTNI